MKCIICHEQAEAGLDEFGRCRVCRKNEINNRLHPSQMCREVDMHDTAEAIERKFGEHRAEPYWAAYRRIIYTDRAPISDEQVDRLIAKGQALLSR